MHIVLLTAEYPPHPGGVGDYTRCLANALVAPDTTVTILTGSDDTYPTKKMVSPDQANKTIPVDHTIRHWNWQCWQDCIAALDRLRPDVLHIQYQTGAYGMHPAITLLPWRLRGLPARPRVVVTYHDLLEPYLFPKAGKIRRWVTHRLAQDSDYAIVTNTDDALLLRTRLPHTPLTLIPIGSNIAVSLPPGYQRAVWRAQFGIQPEDVVIGYFGLLSRNKGVDVLLEALLLLVQQTAPNTPYRLLLIGGEATTPQDRAFAAELQPRFEHPLLQHRIIRTGHVDSHSVSAHLLAVDSVALPFHNGATFRSGSLLAALSHGLPIVTTFPTSSASVTTDYFPKEEQLPQLTHEHHGLLVPAGNAAALATALHRLATHASLRTTLGEHAQALAAQFDWHTIAARHKALYTSL